MRNEMDKAKKLRVCYILSYYFPSYVRSQTIISGLRQIPGVEVLTAVNTTTFIWRYIQTFLYLLFIRFQHKPNLYILGFRGYELYWLIRLLTIGKPLIFDHLVSPYDSLVNEKRRIKSKSILGKLLFWYEKKVLIDADLVLTDTYLHKQFFSELFQITPTHFEVIPVGADESIFYPKGQSKPQEDNLFYVFFYSSFLPLHGIEIILEAANRLRNYPIKLVIVGGRNKDLSKFIEKIEQDKLTNVIHREWINYERLPSLISEADLCLGGPFGNTGQANRVITGKTYQFLAMAKPTIVGELSDMDKVFRDKKNCLIVPQGDPDALAGAICWAFMNQDKLPEMAVSGYALYQSKFSTAIIGVILERIIKKLGAFE